MIYYHVTTYKAFQEHIKYKGLIPKIGERSQLIGETKPAIYLFKTKSDAEYAITNWLGEYFDENETLVILELNIPRAYKSYFDTENADSYEIVCTAAISPVYIKKIYTEKGTGDE